MRTLALLTFLAACGGQAAVDLPAPWDPAEAAVGVGVVESATPAELHVSYAKAPDDLEERWARAYSSSGHTVSDPVGMPGIMSFKIVKGAETFELLITRHGARGDVLVTR